MILEKTPISSMIKKQWYDKDAETQFVQFKDGDIWSYLKVPYFAALSFYNAQSAGSHFVRYIRPVYQSKKLEPATQSSIRVLGGNGAHVLMLDNTVFAIEVDGTVQILAPELTNTVVLAMIKSTTK